MKRYIIAALALSVLGGSAAKADTSKLTAADGWTKITTLPTATDIANNYYVFVDNSNDLMLGVAKGANQNTKWYSLGVFYQNSVEPTSADMNGKTWILETQGDGFAMRNLEYSVSPFQTEWNAAWKFDTNDVYETPNGWCKISMLFSDNSWTIQNGYYPSSGYLGPWTDGNFTDGAECAANKTGDNVGHFQIYAISRTQFKQNLLDNASASNPVDLTPWYVTNATFDANNRTGWTEEGSGGNNNNTIGCEIWHRSDFKIYQDLSVPNGKYKVSLQIAGTTGAGQVYGISGSTTETVTSSAAAGSDFQNTVLSMIQDRTFGKVITSEIEVSDGSLQMGMKCETTDQWLVFDNFKLYCTGVDLSAYQTQLADLVSECNTFINSGVVPEACETVISNAITTYNKTYDTAKEYSAAIVALTAVLNTYRNDTELQSAYAAYYSFKAKVEALTAGQASSDALMSFTTAVNTATNNVEAATATTTITDEISNLRSATLTYISNVEGQFDITFLASQLYSDWKKKDGSAAGIVQDQFLTNRPSDIPSFAESFEWTAETTGNVLYQTVSDLPAGYYQVGMYTMALSTSQRDNITTEANEGDANRTFAFAGDITDASSIQRTGMPIKFATTVDFDDLTTLDVNVHLSSAGALTFGVQKDANGSNWHFAQIMSIVYSKSPDLTQLMATRDALVAEAQGLLAGADADYLTADQKTALQDAITAGNNANTFDELNTVTLTTLPNAINTAKQQVAQAKAAVPAMLAALERFESDYNLADGTDYSRVTMSAGAWTALLAKVDAVTTALDDISQASTYATKAQELVEQMDATDTSLRLFKSYKAMSQGTRSFTANGSVVGGSATDDEMDTDATEQTAIDALNSAFADYAATQYADFSVSAYLGDNLDFSASEGATLNSDNSNNIHAVSGWEVDFADADTWAVLQTHQEANDAKLYMRKNWGSSATTLTAFKQLMLPVGKYQLSLSWNSNMENMTNLSCFKLGNATTAIGEATTEATTLTYDFTLTEPTPFDLVLGFQKTATGNAPAQLVVDDVALTYQKVVDGQVELFTIIDGQDLSIDEGFTATTLMNTRTLAKGDNAYTVCLPYALSSNDDIQFYELSSVKGDKINFKPVDVTEPLMPYLAKPLTENATLNATNASVSATLDVMPETTIDGHTMKGTMSAISRDEAIAMKAYILQSGNQWKMVDEESGASVRIPALRAYILAPENATGRLSSVFGEETGITDVQRSTFFAERSGRAERNVQHFYDLQGRRVEQPTKGLYIVNGKKIVK